MTQYKWEKFLPYNTVTSEPDLEEFEYDDRGCHADPEKKALLSAIPKMVEITPKFGSEVRGLQLSSLTPQQKDDLALFVAERGIVVFRDQDLAERGLDYMREFGSYYGQLHCHPWAAHPKDVPDVTVVFRNSTKGQYLDSKTSKTFNTLAWHHDMSYELNPTGISFLTRLEGPAAGGDTLYVDMCEAYDRLSDKMQAFLETLEVVHSATSQFDVASNSTWSRRACVTDTVHPLVRSHPATGRKALYINKEYCRTIVGLKQEESDALLDMLYKHIYTGIDFHARVKWENGTVVCYDNRTTCHSALLDYPLGSGGLRHLARLAIQCERPFLKKD